MTSGVREQQIGVALLGSTGSVGRQALEVIDALQERFRIVALAARSRSELFREQVLRYRPQLAVVSETEGAPIEGAEQVLATRGGLIAAATHPDVAIVLVATSGHAAIAPTIEAIKCGKIIALANKETLVCAGELIMPLVASRSVPIRPVDSEHSAIWQALGDSQRSDVRRLLITASGGPFRTVARDELTRVTAEQALAHPTWSMGGKITIDSATLMNKGLEVIEAHWLFDMPYERIDVLVHPESVIHSLVEFVDGSLLAQLGVPDMRIPIQYALTYPAKLPRPANGLDLSALGALHFEAPDEERFPCLRLAREAGIAGNTYPTALSAADDEAVAAFLRDDLPFVEIASIVSSVLDRHVPQGRISLDAIRTADEWARQTARELVGQRRRRS